MVAKTKFVADVTIPDNTAILAGTSFTKTWQVLNAGDTAWAPGYKLIFHSGANLAAIGKVSIPSCPPGKLGQISIAMNAPKQPGAYTSNWIFQDDQGNTFGDMLFVVVKVKAVTNRVGRTNNFFVADISIPDGSEVKPGIRFEKTWRIRNTGTLAWNDRYTLNFIDGNLVPDQPTIAVPPVATGGEVNLSAYFSAPEQPGVYTSDWKMKDDHDELFGVKLWTIVSVPGLTTPTPHVNPKVTLQAPAPHFCQRDPRWANIQLAHLATAQSIGRWGCLLSSFAMLASALGHAVDPAKLNDLMVQRGGFTDGFLTRWDALHLVFDQISFDGKFGAGQNTILQINAYLQAARPVPIQVDMTPATAYSDNDQHWVLAVGITENRDNYFINDPIDFGPNTTTHELQYRRRNGRLEDSILSAIFYH